MRIAITDANVFIDLLEANLLEFLFEIGYEIHTTLEVFNELFEEQKNTIQPFVSSKQLYVKSFSSSELMQLHDEDFPSGLSIVDTGVLFYASSNPDFLILSNDKLLRKTARLLQIETHGTLWVLDSIYEQKLVPNQRLYDALMYLQKGGFRRLPSKEVELRLEKWS